MSSSSFNNQSDSFSSYLNGLKKLQAHYQKITELSKWNVEKTSVFSYHKTENSESTDH